MGSVASVKRPSVRLSDTFEQLFEKLDDPGIAKPIYWAVLVSVLAIVQFPFGWTATEENYFQLAYRWARPDAFGPFSAAFDQSGGKFTAFWLYGNLIDLFGYDGAHHILTAIVIPLTAFAVLRLSMLLNLSVVDAVAVLLTYLASGQALMGGEGFLGTVDPKVFCYPFGILAFAEAGSPRARWPLVAIWSAIAVYFHFQIGTVWFAISWMFLTLTSRNWRGSLLAALLFLVLVAPEFVVLFGDYMRFPAASRPEGMPSADHIYAEIRAPHHVAPFAQVGGWKRLAVRGLGYSVVIGAGALYALRHSDRTLRALAVIVLLLAAYQFAAVVISWLDRETLALAKLYLFRPAATLLLLALFMLAAIWRARTSDSPGVRLLPMTAIVSLFLVHASLMNLSGQLHAPSDVTREMIQQVQARAGASDAVLLDPALDGQAGLGRKIARQTFVNWKFVPTNPSDIYRWWGLMERRNATFGGDCSKIEPAARFLVAVSHRASALARCGRLVWSNESYLLIEIERRAALRTVALQAS